MIYIGLQSNDDYDLFLHTPALVIHISPHASKCVSSPAITNKPLISKVHTVYLSSKSAHIWLEQSWIESNTVQMCLK